MITDHEKRLWLDFVSEARTAKDICSSEGWSAEAWTRFRRKMGAAELAIANQRPTKALWDNIHALKERCSRIEGLIEQIRETFRSTVMQERVRRARVGIEKKVPKFGGKTKKARYFLGGKLSAHAKKSNVATSANGGICPGDYLKGVQLPERGGYVDDATQLHQQENK